MEKEEKEMKRIRVPDKDVRLHLHEIAVTQTRTFQRLFYLKQLGLAYLVYPGAVHSRAFHSILCLEEANNILNASGVKATDDERRTVRMAALLHDIAHVPFSHTLEDEHQVLEKHDRSSRLEKVIALLKDELDTEAASAVDAAVPVLHAITSEKIEDKDWRNDLVGNTVCADLLAYITTDAQWTGIEKRPGYYRIYDYLQKYPSKGKDRLCVKLTKGGLRQDVVSAILDLLDMRYALTERVIFHHAKCVASAMLARAAFLCGLQEDSVVNAPGGKRQLYEIGDELFLEYLEGEAKSKSNGAEALIEGLRTRKLYKRIFKLCAEDRNTWDRGRAPGTSFCEKWRKMKTVEELLGGIEERLTLPRGSLVLWCPNPKSGMKLVESLVIWESDRGIEGPEVLRSKVIEDLYPSVHNRVHTIEEQYKGLWTFWVAIHPGQINKAAEVMEALQEEIGVPCDRLFHETHMMKQHGYKVALENQQSVNRVIKRKISPKVVPRVQQLQAARGEESLDEASILQSVEEIAHDAREKDRVGQMTILDQEDTPSAPRRQGKKKDASNEKDGE